MTSKYSEQEVLSALSSLTASPAVLDRRGQQTAEEIVRSFVELSYGCLNSDIDSVYSLIRSFTRRQINLCTELVAKTSELYEIAAAAANGSDDIDFAGLAELQADLQRLPFMSGAQMEANLANTRAKIEAFLSTGTTGKSVKSSKARAMELLYDIVGLEAMCVEGAGRFSNAVSNYMDAGFEDVSKRGQVERAAIASLLLDGNISDPNESKLVLAVLTTLLERSSQPKRDIRDPKYAGSTVPLPGDRPMLEGGSLPLILRDDPWKQAYGTPKSTDIKYTNQSEERTEAIHAPVSTGPTMVFSVPDSTFIRNDSGYLMPPAGSLGPGPLIVTSCDSGTPGNLLSDQTHTSSITGDEVSTAYFCPLLKTTVIPGSVAVSLTIGLTTTSGNSGLNLVVGSEVGEFVSMPIVLRDTDSDGVLYASNGLVAGEVFYNKGIISIINPVAETDIVVTDGVHISYKYNPFAKTASWHAQSGDHVDDGHYRYWEQISVWSDNSHKSLDTNSIMNASELASKLSQLAPEVSCTAKDHVLELSLAYGGSAARLSFPSRASIEFNPSPFAPVWNTTPTDINQAMGLILSNHSPSYGKDTPKSEVKNDFGDAMVLGVNKSSAITNVQIQVESPSTVVLSNLDMDSVALGDNLKVESPVNVNAKIVEIGDGGMVQVHPDLPLEISVPGPGLVFPDTWSGSVTKDRLYIEPSENDPLSRLWVESDGLGFSGISNAASNTVLLDTSYSLDDAATAPGYTIKPGDVVIEKDGDVGKPLGEVQSVDGNVVTFRLVSDNFTYPYSSVEIYALGWSRFRKLQPKVSESRRKLLDLDAGSDLLVKGASYLNSGSGQDAFYKAVLSLRDNIGELRNHYLDYEAHTVNTTDSLLRFFREDKISVFNDLLSECRFSEIAEMTPESLSSQTSLETKMEEAHAFFGGDRELWESTYGYDVLNDYVHEPKDENGPGNRQTFKDAEEP